MDTLECDVDGDDVFSLPAIVVWNSREDFLNKHEELTSPEALDLGKYFLRLITEGNARFPRPTLSKRHALINKWQKHCDIMPEEV